MRKKIKNQTNQRPYIMIYCDFLDSKLIDPYEKLVFIALKRFSDKKSQCYPSLKMIADVTGLSKSKVQDALKGLENKNIIAAKKRMRANGGRSSNLYTLYDTEDMWNDGNIEKLSKAAKESEIGRSIQILTKAGYEVIPNEKGLDDKPAKEYHQALQLNKLYMNDTTTDSIECQSTERYSIEQIKRLFDYEAMTHDYPDLHRDIDTIMEILHDVMNTAKQIIKIGGENKPAPVVMAKLAKLQKDSIIYGIQQYQGQTERIKNPRAYMLTILYHAPEQMILDVHNQVMHDMSRWNDSDQDSES